MIIGPYRILEKIGEGGMGVIYKAEHCTLEQVVAIKSLTVNIDANPELTQRFIREAKIQAKLSHPNVVNVLNFLDIGGSYYIVMEYVEGETLESLIKSKGLLPPDYCIAMFRQILSGAAYAHSIGIIHRDIKPSNIIIKKDGTVKLTDFGIARISGDFQHTRTGVKVGTIWYMSPEQVKGQPAGVASDIYSLGVTLFEMLTGKVPFSGDSEYSIMKDIVESPPPSPRDIYPYVPIPMEKIIVKAMAKDPAERFRSAEEFAAALERPEAVLSASPPPRFPEEIRRRQLFPFTRSSRNRAAMAACLAAFLLCAIVALYLQNTAKARPAAAAPAAPAAAEVAEAPHAPPAAAPNAEALPVQVATPTKQTLVQERAEPVAAPDREPADAALQSENREKERVQELLRSGLRLHNDGDYGKAIRMYEKALELAPGNEGARKGIADARRAREVERQMETLK